MAAENMIREDVKLIFWDFDGVIKESVEIKTKAFVQLFSDRGREFQRRVREHHENNGGMSRYEKIRTYLKWSKNSDTDEEVLSLCRRFSNLVMQGVIDAPWVPGAESFLRQNKHRKAFVLVSATPQEEIETIVSRIGMEDTFTYIFGYPKAKANGIKDALQWLRIEAADSMMIGDAMADLTAAEANGVPFLLRLHKSNEFVFKDYEGMSVRDMRDL